MADIEYREDVPVIEVRVLSGDRLVALEVCTSEAQVAEVVRRWSDRDTFSILVDDFTGVHVPDVADRAARQVDLDSSISAAVPSGAGWE